MVCDKCGFEHNNRSACPKCGARAVYVDENYLKRRQEWEEAQKKGGAGTLPPGIMHSTLEERATDTKGGSETAGLSLHVKNFLKTAFDWIKDKWQKLLTWITGKIRRRRGVNNPVIRELKFDEGPETLDESKLVLSHKVFKDNRKYYYIGAGALVVLAAVIIILVNIIGNIDRSRVMFFDGRYLYYADDKNKPVMGDIDGGLAIVDAKDGNLLACGPKGIYFFQNGKDTIVEADNPEIVTYSSNLSTVIFVEKDNLYLGCGGEKHWLDVDVDKLHDIACGISDNGKYWVAATADLKDDSTEYVLYTGDSKGVMNEVYRGDKDVEIAKLDDKGRVIYLELTVGEYGVVNNRDIKNYYNGEVSTLATEVAEYDFFENQLVYIKDNEKMYRVSDRTDSVFLDDEVKGLQKNLSNDKLYYLKDEGCYCMGKDGPVKVFEPSKSVFSLVCKENSDRIWYYDRDAFYEVKDGKETVYKLMPEVPVVYLKKSDAVYLVDKNGLLYCVDESAEVVSEGVSDMVMVEGMTGIAFLKGDIVYINKYNSKKCVNIFTSSELNSVIYSKNKYYIADFSSVLWQVNENGDKKDSLGNVEKYILVD